VDPDETPRLLARDTAEALRRELAALGFAAVTLDAVGYRARPNA
jgi:PP-loop superfamily ATP-utilizing enzyme